MKHIKHILICGIFFGGLYSQCDNLPKDYSDFQYCQEFYENQYFIGSAKINKDNDDARNRALLDLSSSIATSILSDMDVAMKEQTVLTVGEDGEKDEEYQLEDYFTYNLQTKSKSYIQNAIYRRFKIENENYFYAFKNKEDFLKETTEVNEFILREARQSFKNWQITMNLQALFKAYVLVRSISGYAPNENQEVLISILDLKNEIDQDFENYMDGLKFVAPINNVKITPFQRNAKPIKVDIKLDLDKIKKVDKKNKSNAYPNYVNIILEGLVSDAQGWKNNTRREAVRDREINFQIGTILSSSKFQTIYFYPDVTEFSSLDQINLKVDSEIRKLSKLLKYKAMRGQFGTGLSLEISQDIVLSYNKKEIKNRLTEIGLKDKEKELLFSIIQESINENAKYEPQSANKAKFRVQIDRSKKKIIFKSDLNWEKIFEVDYLYDLNDRSRGSFLDKGDFDRIRGLIVKYIEGIVEDRKKITIDCKICERDHLVYYTRQNKTRGIKLKKNKFTVEKGSLHKIELKRGRDVYLTIDDRYLQNPDRTDLSAIINDFLQADDNQKYMGVLEGPWACFPDDDDINFRLSIPDGYYFDDFKIKWNGKTITNNNLLTGKFSENQSLFIEKNGYKIGKKVSGQNTSNYSYNLLSISPNFSFNNPVNITLQVEKMKLGFGDVLIPGILNFRLLKANEGSKFWGTFKILALSFLAANAYNESSQFDESKDFYERSKIEYENKVDGSPEEYALLYNTMSQNYNRMIASQESRNNSLYLLGGLYAFNSIELLKIRFWN